MTENQYDLIVYGATPGGIKAAREESAKGLKVALISGGEPRPDDVESALFVDARVRTVTTIEIPEGEMTVSIMNFGGFLLEVASGRKMTCLELSDGRSLWATNYWDASDEAGLLRAPYRPA